VSVNARINVNVALNRPSYQVNTYIGGTGITYYARYANDGNLGQDLINGPCAHTETATNPWWAVDLGVALFVDGVKFFNRNGAGMYSMLSLS